jgi:hypothetical protein
MGGIWLEESGHPDTAVALVPAKRTKFRRRNTAPMRAVGKADEATGLVRRETGKEELRT